MTDRRLAPLTALTTLARRPAPADGRARRSPQLPAAARALAGDRQRRLLRGPPGGHARDRGREPRGAGRGRGPPGLAGPLPAGAAASWAQLAELFDLPELAVEDAITGPPAAEVRAVRGHAVRRPQGRPVPRRGRGGRVRRAAPVPRRRTSPSPCGTASRPTSRGCGGGWRASPALLAKGSEAVLYAILDAVVDGYSPVVGRARQRHRRDRDRGLPRGPGGLAAHLRAVAGGRWSSSGPSVPLTGDPRRDHGRLRQVRRRRGAAQLPARRRRPRHAGATSGRRASGCSCATSSPSTRRWSPSGRTRRSGSSPRRRSRRARRSRRSPRGRPSCSRRPWSARSTG